MVHEAAARLLELTGHATDGDAVTHVATQLRSMGTSQIESGFVEHLAGLVESRPLLEELDALELGDLLVAWRCAQGQPSAVAALDEKIATVAPALTSRGLGGLDLDDVCQAVRVHLLVAEDGGAPRILQYRGRGRLGGFVRVVAVRMLLAARRSEARTSVLDELQHVVATSDDPELDRIKRDSLDEFRAALADAFEGLPATQKVMLRHQLVDQLSIDLIGSMYRIHRSTAARRLANAREALVRATRIGLAKRLGLAPFEISSVMRLIQSRLGEAVDALPSR